MNKTVQQFKEGLFTNNPVLVQLVGMCATLATSTSLENGLGMGLATTAVLICSNIVISLLRKLIPNKIRIACYILIIASFVTAVDLLLQAFLPDLSDSLGLFIPLIVVNCIILARAESFASKNGVFRSAIDGIAMGLGFTLVMVILGAVREIIGAGTILGVPVFGDGFHPVMLFIMPAGGFLTLGVLIAVFQAIMKKAEKRGNNI
ncbi:MAG: electron transport complex subunit E [Clostridia bacterium]|nr:electron transport complex subunit E [Clostridia bacterium]